MRLRVRHVARYAAERPILSATHVLRLRPRALATQRVLEAAIAASPTPSRRRDGIDHFGNPVSWLTHDEPHERGEIVADAALELLPAQHPDRTPPWERVAEAVRSQAASWRDAEFAFPSPLAPPSPEAREAAERCFPPGRSVADGLAALTRSLGPTPGAPWDGVHARLAALRSLGLPARFMAGFRWPGEGGPASPSFWASCWLGPGFGWLDLRDENNDSALVCVALGRDRGDVEPARSTLAGGARCEVSIALEVVPASSGTACPGS